MLQWGNSFPSENLSKDRLSPLLIAGQRLRLLNYTAPIADGMEGDLPPSITKSLS